MYFELLLNQYKVCVLLTNSQRKNQSRGAYDWSSVITGLRYCPLIGQDVCGQSGADPGLHPRVSDSQ